MYFIKSFKYYFIFSLLFILVSANATENEKWVSPKLVEGAKTINLQQAKKAHAGGIKFIDVRSDRQYGKRHIPSALHLSIKTDFTQVNLLKHFKKDTPFVIYCNSVHCSLSYKATEKAVGWGFTQVQYYRDGLRAWRLDGNPLEYGKNEN